MTIKTFLIMLLMLFSASYPSIAKAADSYITPDQITGVTPSIVASPIANTPAVVPQDTPDGVAYDPVASTPPDTNSTGITLQTIFNADHGYVQDSPVRTYLAQLLPPDGTTGVVCEQHTPSGATVYRYDFSGTEVSIVPHDDAFCMNQGCVYYNRNGKGICE